MSNTGDDMEFKSLFSGALLALFMAPAFGHDIYKCVENGTIRYSEEKCGDNAEKVTLKELAAPVKEVDPSTIEGQKTRNKISSLEFQVKRHEKRIRKYRKKMQYELGALQKKVGIKTKEPKKARESNWEKEATSQLKNISSSVDQGVIAEQMTAVVNHYKVLIEAEEFQIRSLQRDIELEKRLNTVPKK